MIKLSSMLFDAPISPLANVGNEKKENDYMRQVYLWSCLLLFLGLYPEKASAGGISVDAGLTPAEDRWIVRGQVRNMKKHDDPTSMGREMETWAFPMVIAYGLRSDTMVMLRQKILHRKMTMLGSTEEDTGISDLFFLVKYKAYRVNYPDYTFGLAPTLGVDLPTGDSTFGSETWNLHPGLYASYRSGPWAADLSTSYAWNGFADKGTGGIDPGNEFMADLALAFQFSVANRHDMSLTPVLEFSYKHIKEDSLNGTNEPNTGESVVYISPGLKWTISSTIIEGLVQIPVYQNQNGDQLKRDTTWLLGFRYMF